MGKSNRQINMGVIRMCILMVDVDRLLGRVFELKAGVIDFWKGVPNHVVREFRMILIVNVLRNPNNYGRIVCVRQMWRLSILTDDRACNRRTDTGLV